MRPWRLVPWFLAIITACGSDVASTAGPCAQRGGSYIAKYTQRTGSCGAGTERVQNVTQQPTTVDRPCSGNITYSPDNCEVTYESTCPEDGLIRGGTLTISGHSKWDAAATYGTAVEQWTVLRPDKTTACLSTYDVTMSRQ